MSVIEPPQNKEINEASDEKKRIIRNLISFLGKVGARQTEKIGKKRLLLTFGICDVLNLEKRI